MRIAYSFSTSQTRIELFAALPKNDYRKTRKDGGTFDMKHTQAMAVFLLFLFFNGWVDFNVVYTISYTTIWLAGRREVTWA